MRDDAAKVPAAEKRKARLHPRWKAGNHIVSRLGIKQLPLHARGRTATIAVGRRSRRGGPCLTPSLSPGIRNFRRFREIRLPLRKFAHSVASEAG